MEKCHGIITPIIEDGTVHKENEDDTTFPYKDVIGVLMYLILGFRPALSFTGSVLSRHLENPIMQDWVKVR